MDIYPFAQPLNSSHKYTHTLAHILLSLVKTERKKIALALLVVELLLLPLQLQLQLLLQLHVLFASR